MSKPASSGSAAPRASRWVAPIAWVWITVLAAASILIALVWLDGQEQRVLAHAADEQALLGQARVDLAKGYLHVSLADRPRYPFDRAQGLALLDQAGSSLRRASLLQRDFTSAAAPGAGGPLHAQFTAFAEAVARFRNLLLDQRADQGTDPGREAGLRIGFLDLERKADAIEARIRRDLSQTMRRFARVRAAILWGSGGLLALICAAVVASSRAKRRAEAALRESEALFRNLFEGHTAAKLIVDPETGSIVDANQAAAGYYGWSREQLRRMRIQDISVLSPEEMQRNVRMAWSMERTHFESRHRRADGSIGDVDLFSSRIEVKGRYLLHAIILDSAARKRAEADRERLTTAIEQAAEMVLVSDAQGGIVYVNPAFEAVTGYTRAEVLGQNPRLLKSGAQDEGYYRALWDTISSGRTWRGRVVNRRKDGRFYTEEESISPIRDAAGVITSYVAVKRDISSTLALEAQLLQSQKMEGIGRLAGGIAHDFNNTLSVILGCAGFALEGLRADDPVRDDLLEIEKAGRHAASLTRQLLAFSRKQVLQPVPLDLNRLLTEMEKMLRRIIGEDVELVQVLEPGLGLVTADPGQIEQVFMNLAVNSRDAMPDGGKLIIETANVDLDAEYTERHAGAVPGPHVMVAVTDSGAGMDERTMARIFEPFFTTRGPGKGTGLGLSTVYGVVKQSGGSIYVYSEPGRGTTFKVYLPRHASAATPASPATPGRPRSAGAETILLAEDDPAVRGLARRILDAAGYTVLTAANGVEALDICERHPSAIHLVLTDVVMPLMGGRVFAERLAKVRPGTRVLYMSGYTDNAIVHHGILDPGLQFIGKPLTQLELLRKVREVLDGGGPPDA